MVSCKRVREEGDIITDPFLSEVQEDVEAWRAAFDRDYQQVVSGGHQCETSDLVEKLTDLGWLNPPASRVGKNDDSPHRRSTTRRDSPGAGPDSGIRRPTSSLEARRVEDRGGERGEGGGGAGGKEAGPRPGSRVLEGRVDLAGQAFGLQ